MVQTQGSIEDRLAALESAGDALAATFAARQNELATQMTNLQLQISNLSEGILQSLVEQQKTHQNFVEKQKSLQDINTEQQKVMQGFINDQQKAIQGMVDHQNAQQSIIDKQQKTMNDLVEQQKTQQDIAKEQKTLQNIIAENQKTMQYLVKQQNAQRDIEKEHKPLQDLIDQQKVLETKFDHILEKENKHSTKSEQLLENNGNIKQRNDYPEIREGCYVNWEEKHDYLMQGIYVWFDDLKEIVTRLNHYDSAPEKLINALKTPFTVNKTTRFPQFGLFVNVNNQLIKHEIGEIVFAIKNGRSLDSANYRICIQKLISGLNYLYDNNKVYNVTSYEEMCNLKWVDDIRVGGLNSPGTNHLIDLSPLDTDSD